MSTKRQHTPGPWNRGVAQQVYQGAKWDPSNQQRLIASCEPTTRTQADWEETWANARLIAAAPDMLDALQAALLFLSGFEDCDNPEDVPTALSQVRAAIAKATGEE